MCARSACRLKANGSGSDVPPRGSAFLIERPVLDREIHDAAELRGVVRHERQPRTARVRGNEEVVGADEGTALLQVRANVRIVLGGLLCVGDLGPGWRRTDEVTGL